MESKNYYPLRQGLNGDTIVSDTPTNDNPDESDIKYYGGYLVCACPPSLAKQLTDAYNEKYGCSEFNYEEVTALAQKYGISPRLALLFYQEMKALGKYIPPAYPTPLTEVKLPTNPDHLVKDGAHFDHLTTELNDMMKKAMANEIHKEENSAHSFTEGADLGRTHSADELLRDPALIEYERILPRATPSPEMQMKDYGYRNELPDSIIHTELVDVEKVIEDLLHLIGLNISHDNHNHPAIQNAEAALGMLQAFRETPNSVCNVPHDADKLIQRDLLRGEIARRIPDVVGKYSIAETIIFAVEEILKKRNL